VHVDDYVLDASEVGERHLDLGEGRAPGAQVEVAAEVDHAEAHAVSLDHASAAAGLGAQEVGRAHDPRLALQVGVDLAAVVGVVAERDCVHASGEQLVGDLGSDPQAAGGVLRVDHHERRRVALAQDRQAVEQRAPADAADEIADEEDVHAAAVGSLVRRGRQRLLPHLLGRLSLSHTLVMVGGT